MASETHLGELLFRDVWANLIAREALIILLLRRVEELRGLIGRAGGEEDEKCEEMI